MRTSAEYNSRLRRCASILVADQDIEGGWGLTRSQLPSLVNTTEVLHVLNAAGNARHAIESGMAYLAANVPSHCAPRAEGGRGEKTRYVSFSLWALAEYGHDEVPHIAEAIDWMLNWLHRWRQEDGWSEEAGVRDCSLFQTALIARGLSVLLRRADSGDVHLDAGQRQRVADLLGVAVPGLLGHKLVHGWPQRAYGSHFSAAKTSWCLLGLAEAAEIPQPPATVDDWILRGAISDTVRHLIGRLTDWRREIEADPDIIGTVWSHLNYLLCLEAIATCADDPMFDRLLPAWNDLHEAWSDEYGQWLELTQPPMPTVRANCYSIRALEALRHQFGERGFASVIRPDGVLAAGGNWELVVDGPGQYALTLDGNRHRLDLSAKQAKLLTELADSSSDPAPVPSDQLAKRLGIAPTSLGVTVSRLNSAMADQVPALERCRLVVAERGNGYRLNVSRIIHR